MAHHVTVGVLNDLFVASVKGKLPEFTDMERLSWFETLADEAYIEYGRLNADTGVWTHPDAILEGGYSVVAVGSDWAGKDYYSRLGLSQAKLDALGVTLAYIPHYLEISATDLKGRING